MIEENPIDRQGKRKKLTAYRYLMKGKGKKEELKEYIEHNYCSDYSFE